MTFSWFRLALALTPCRPDALVKYFTADASSPPLIALRTARYRYCQKARHQIGSYVPSMVHRWHIRTNAQHDEWMWEKCLETHCKKCESKWGLGGMLLMRAAPTWHCLFQSDEACAMYSLSNQHQEVPARWLFNALQYKYTRARTKDTKDRILERSQETFLPPKKDDIIWPTWPTNQTRQARHYPTLFVHFALWLITMTQPN